jgi:hypothetical protein
MTDCKPVWTTGIRCPRLPEVRVHLIHPDGSTHSRTQVCALHGLQAASLAFVDVTIVRAPSTVVIAPLVTS